MLLSLIGCQAAPGPVKTKIVEVKVETQVPLDAKLTAQEPKPKRPAAECRDANGSRTICNRALADWINAYDAALERINERMRRIFGLQPKEAK